MAPMWQRIAAAGLQPLLARRRPFPQTAAATFAGDLWRISIFNYGADRSYAAPAQASKAKGKSDADESKGPRINKAITAPMVRLVSEEGHVVVSIKEALDRAVRLNLDLVEVQRTANPPVCKIMDFHKEKFKQDVKEKERAKSKSAVSLKNGQNKEVRFKGKTELKDLKIKADSIIRLMERGYRVKCTAMPTGKGEEDLGPLLSRLLTMIEDVSVVESGPHVDSKQAYAIVKHVKYAKSGKKMNKVLDSVAKGIQSAVHKIPLAANSTSEAVQVPDAEDVWEPVDSDSDAENAISSNQADTNSSKEFDNFISKAETVDYVTNGQMGHVFSRHTPGDGNISNSVPKPGVGSLRSLLETEKEPSIVETNRYSRRTEANGRSNKSHFTENINNNFSRLRGASNSGRVPQEHLRQGHQNTHGSPSSISQVNNSMRNSHPNDHGRLRMANNPNDPKSPSQGYGSSSSRSSTSHDERNLRSSGTGDVGNLSSRRPSLGIFSSSKGIPQSEQRNLGDETVRKDKDPTSQTPKFGVFVSTKPSASTDNKTSGDVATSKSISSSHPAKRYGIFSATETASSNS